MTDNADMVDDLSLKEQKTQNADQLDNMDNLAINAPLFSSENENQTVGLLRQRTGISKSMVDQKEQDQFEFPQRSGSDNAGRSINVSLRQVLTRQLTDKVNERQEEIIKEEQLYAEDTKVLDVEFEHEQEMQLMQIKKRKSCCKMFTLGTSISVFLYIDILMLLFIINMMNFNLAEILSKITGKVPEHQKNQWYNPNITGQDEKQNKNNKPDEVGTQYHIVSDYSSLGIFILKVYKGIQFFLSTIQRPKNNDLLLDPLAEEKITSMILIRQREALQEYLTVTIIFQWFTLIQEIAQIWIFYDRLKNFLVFFYLISFALFCTFYASRKMQLFLDELNFMIELQHKVLWLEHTKQLYKENSYDENNNHQNQQKGQVRFETTFYNQPSKLYESTEQVRLTSFRD